MSRFKSPTVVGVLMVLALALGVVLLAACAGPAGERGAAGSPGPAGPAGPSAAAGDVARVVDEKFSKVDTKLPLWAVQPGTAPMMRMMTQSFNLMWFAAQAGNWEMAGFEVYRSGEEVKVPPITRPARAATLKAWAEPNLKALADAVKAKDKAAFEKAYDNAVAGCNVCHLASQGGGFKMQAIKVTRPTAPLFSNIDFKGP